jgi:hypothetical protein
VEFEEQEYRRCHVCKERVWYSLTRNAFLTHGTCPNGKVA